MTKPHDRLTKEEEQELNHLMDKYKNDDALIIIMLIVFISAFMVSTIIFV